MSSKKDGAGAAAAGKRQEQFRQRGDLEILKSGDLSDCIVVCGPGPDGRFTTHRAFLASRSGWFRKKLAEDPQHDAAGKQVIEMGWYWHYTPARMALVMEFIYGAGLLDALENPTNESFIATCVDISNLGQDFEIPSMAEYAMNHFGKYLNTKLKEICVFPAQRAKKALLKDDFVWHLKSGISHFSLGPRREERELYKMLVDFVAAGREVILSNEDFHIPCSITQGLKCDYFLKDVLLTQYRGEFQSKWMRDLAAKPETLPNRLVKCVVCGMDLDLLGGEGAHYSPWSQGLLMSMYTEVCCSRCAKDEDNQDDDGMISWSVFK